LACWASPAYLAAAHTTTRRSRWYGLLLHLFIAAMATAVLAGNLGILWVAVEATTIVTAFLVGHHRDRPALEAAWKYVVICSAAIRHRLPRPRPAVLHRQACRPVRGRHLGLGDPGRARAPPRSRGHPHRRRAGRRRVRRQSRPHPAARLATRCPLPGPGT